MIDSITLTNWKSHEQAEFKFKPGTNVIVGKMGSGKSSIFQAISFALFGTFSELKKKDVKISELITRGSKRRVAEVQLILRILGKSYKIKRKIDESRGSEATVRDEEEALVAGPNPTAANDYIKALLKVDDEIFLRTVYAIQNDIDMILKYAPKERKSKIDELMGLDKFEMARDNAQTLRNRISRSKEEIEKLLTGFNVESLKSSLTDLEAQSQMLEKSIYSSKRELDEKRKLQDKARVELSHLREKFKEVSKLEERKSSLEKQIAELQGKIKGEKLDASKEEVESELKEIRQGISSKTEEKKRLASELERVRAELIEIEGKYSVLQEKNSELDGKIAEIEAFKEKFPDIDFQEIASEISELKKLIDEKREQNKMVEVELKNIRKHLEELQLSDAFCPLCKQELQGNKKDELISRKKKEIAEFQYKNSGLKDELYKLEQRKSEIDEIVEGNEKIIDSILEEEDINLKKSELSGKISGLAEAKTKARATYEKLSKRTGSLEQEISELQERNSGLIEVKYLYDSKARQEELSEELSLVESELFEKGKEASLLENTEKKFESLLKDIQQIETRLESFSELIKEKENRRRDLTQKLDEIKKLEDKARLMELRTGFLDRLKTAIEATQLTLRDELILAVNEVMNSIWLDIYPYDKWQGIRLSASESDYALQLRTLDDAWVNVAGFASGGERMLAALAVRIAFARILAPGLSLLILDEPTHNLDDKAVQTLVEILQEKIANMLDQIFIITHDERLAEAAENVIRI